MKPNAFADGSPHFDPAAFFTGQTRSWGVRESRANEPVQRITTETQGHWEGGTLHIEQELAFDGGKRQHRSWRIHRLDPHHFTATANDMIGAARGQAYGNVFTWSFTLALSPGNPLTNVRMTQWMYLQPDGRTMINRTTVRKSGIVVAQITEEFRRR